MSPSGSSNSRFGFLWLPVWLCIAIGWSVSPASADVPGAPTNPTARAVGAHTVEFSWSVNAVDVNNIQGFYVGDNNGGGTIPDSTARATQFGECPGKSATFSVAAYNQEGHSAYAQTSFTLPNQAPEAIPEANAWPYSPSEIELQFNGGIPCNATGLKVERATSVSGTPPDTAFSEIASGPFAQPWIDHTPLPNVKYYYRTKAFNAVGSSATYSPISEAMISMLAPNPVNAYIYSGTQILIDWTPNNQILVTNIILERRSGSSGSTYTQVATTPGNITWVIDIPPGQGSYYYRVKAVNSVLGASPYSPEVPITFGPPSGAPSNLSIAPIQVVTRSGLRISWTDNANNEQSTIVERAQLAGGPWAALFTRQNAQAAFLTYYDDFTASPNVTYFYRALAFNRFGDSAYSNIASGSFSSGGGSIQPPNNLRVKSP